MANYNMSNFTGADNIFVMYEAIDQQSGNILSVLVLIGAFMILLLTLLKRSPPGEAFTAASGFTALLSLFFLAMEVLPIIWTIAFTFIFSVSAVALYLTNRAT